MSDYTTCTLIQGDYPCTDTGHPVSTYTIAGVEQPIVFLNWIATQGKDSLRIHEEWAEVRYPIMLCGHKNCVNPSHMAFGRRDLNGIPNDTADKRIKTFHREQLKRNNVMDQESLRSSITEMSDEELMELIRGTRESRRSGAQKKKAASSARESKKKVKNTREELASLLASMSDEEKLLLLADLEDDDDGDDN